MDGCRVLNSSASITWTWPTTDVGVSAKRGLEDGLPARRDPDRMTEHPAGHGADHEHGNGRIVGDEMDEDLHEQDADERRDR